MHGNLTMAQLYDTNSFVGIHIGNTQSDSVTWSLVPHPHNHVVGRAMKCFTLAEPELKYNHLVFFCVPKT